MNDKVEVYISARPAGRWWEGSIHFPVEGMEFFYQILLSPSGEIRQFMIANDDDDLQLTLGSEYFWQALIITTCWFVQKAGQRLSKEMAHSPHWSDDDHPAREIPVPTGIHYFMDAVDQAVTDLLGSAISTH